MNTVTTGATVICCAGCAMLTPPTGRHRGTTWFLAMRQRDSIRRRRMLMEAFVAVAVIAAVVGIPLGLQSSRQKAEPVPSASTSAPVPTPSITSPADLPLADCTVAALTAPAAAGAFSTWGSD